MNPASYPDCLKSQKERSVMKFTGKYDFLNNDYPSPIRLRVKGDTEFRVYASVNAAIQAFKDPANAAFYASLSAKDVRRNLAIMNPEQVKTWNKNKLRFMKKAIRAKFDQNAVLALKLRSIGQDKIEADFPDGYWGVGKDRHGRNELGKILENESDLLREMIPEDFIDTFNSENEHPKTVLFSGPDPNGFGFAGYGQKEESYANFISQLSSLLETFHDKNGYERVLTDTEPGFSQLAFLAASVLKNRGSAIASEVYFPDIPGYLNSEIRNITELADASYITMHQIHSENPETARKAMLLLNHLNCAAQSDLLVVLPDADGSFSKSALDYISVFEEKKKPVLYLEADILQKDTIPLPALKDDFEFRHPKLVQNNIFALLGGSETDGLLQILNLKGTTENRKSVKARKIPEPPASWKYLHNKENIDLLDIDKGIIINQVSVTGSTNTPAFRILSEKYPKIKSAYQNFFAKYSPEDLFGGRQVVRLSDQLAAVNIYSAKPGGLHDHVLTDEDTLVSAISDICAFYKDLPVYIPINTGADEGYGSWRRIYNSVCDIQNLHPASSPEIMQEQLESAVMI